MSTTQRWRCSIGQRLPMLIAVLALHASIQGPAGAQQPDPGDLAGVCLELELGRWRPPPGGDSLEIAPPSRVRFEATPDPRSTTGRFALVTVPGALSSIHRFSAWRPAGTDSVILAWSTGVAGLTITLPRTGTELRGTARAVWDTDRPPQTADAVARRVACDAPHPPHARDRHVARAVPLEGGDSVALGQAFGRLRREADSVSGRTFRLRRTPTGLFAGARGIELLVADDTVRRIRVRYPSDVGFDTLVRAFTGVLGTPVTVDSPRTGDSAAARQSRVLGWMNRTTRLWLNRSALVRGGWEVVVLLVDPRYGP